MYGHEHFTTAWLNFLAEVIVIAELFILYLPEVVLSVTASVPGNEETSLRRGLGLHAHS